MLLGDLEQTLGSVGTPACAMSSLAASLLPIEQLVALLPEVDGLPVTCEPLPGSASRSSAKKL